jgi:hypothetical protein
MNLPTTVAKTKKVRIQQPPTPTRAERGVETILGAFVLEANQDETWIFPEKKLPTESLVLGEIASQVFVLGAIDVIPTPALTQDDIKHACKVPNRLGHATPTVLDSDCRLQSRSCRTLLQCERHWPDVHVPC